MTERQEKKCKSNGGRGKEEVFLPTSAGREEGQQQKGKLLAETGTRLVDPLIPFNTF